jgi:smad nuclear-interacting protein 1
MKHQPPAEAAKPDKKWRLYVFKGDNLAEDDPYYLHRYSMARDRRGW